jgi:hypothetical protein
MSSNNAAGGWIFLAIVAAVVWYFFIRGSDWAARSYAGEHYHVPDQKIVVEKRPHDCDFWTAPLGAKHCSYKREYLVQWYMLAPWGAHHPIQYTTMQEDQPPRCLQPGSDCFEIADLQPDEHPDVFFGWQARRVLVQWRRVEE